MISHNWYIISKWGEIQKTNSITVTYFSLKLKVTYSILQTTYRVFLRDLSTLLSQKTNISIRQFYISMLFIWVLESMLCSCSQSAQRLLDWSVLSVVEMTEDRMLGEEIIQESSYWAFLLVLLICGGGEGLVFYT